MKFLLINQTFYPDVVATAQHLTDLAVRLKQEGHEVTVVTGQTSYAGKKKFAAREIWCGIEVLRVWPFAFRRSQIVSRIIYSAGFFLAVVWKLLWLPRFDKVVTLTSPPMISVLGLLFAKLRRSKLIVWMMDLNPDQAIAAGWISESSLQARGLNKMLRITLSRTERIIVLDDYMKERILRRKISPRKIAVIPPWSHDEDLETIPHEKNPFREKHNLQDKFVVMYSGNHSVCHPLDTLLGAAYQLRDKPEFQFVFIGGGVRVKEVSDFREQHQLSNILQMGYVDRHELKYSLSAADAHVVVMGDPYVGIVHPCKIYSILEIGRFFLYIGPEKSHVGDLVTHYALGAHVEHGDANGVVSILEDANIYSDLKKEYIEKESKELAKSYSMEYLMQRFMQEITIMDKLSKKGM